MVKVRLHGTPSQVEQYTRTLQLMHEAVMQMHAGLPLEDVMDVLADIKVPYLIVSESQDYPDREPRSRTGRISGVQQVRRYLDLAEGPHA